MKKIVLVTLFLVLLMSLYAEWKVGEPVTQDYSWVDNNGEEHSLHELTSAGKAVMFFWSGAG